ncbi:hypothetical protein F5Y04DRAFT_273861 [Hypomontagnella monticulosa]|nr:hypothetical protein F5Y04DRAFT_273861 [Hypomontagnella monticulosa]
MAATAASNNPVRIATKNHRLKRKYGKRDFNRFEPLVGSVHYLGSGSIGEVEVACKFLFRESRWGVLNRNPGGVVYLDLTFTEPFNCRLKGATVMLTLDEEDHDLRRYFRAMNAEQDPQVPVQIVQYGPHHLSGQIDEALKIDRRSFQPWVDVGGIAGAGGIGLDSEMQYVHRSQWKFSSFPIPNKLGKPSILKWQLTESELDSQPRHNNTFHTAFAFEHDGQPFLMKVEVSGTLEGVTSNMRQKAKQIFKFPVERRPATTLVSFGGRNNPYKTPLDELADNLPLEMIEKNTEHVTQATSRVSSSNPTEAPHQEESMTEQENTHYYSSVELDQGSSDVDIENIRNMALTLLPSGLLPMNLADVSESNLRSVLPSAMPNNQEHNEPAREEATIELRGSHEEIRKLLQEASVPGVFQLIILWILAAWMKPLLPSKRDSS